MATVKKSAPKKRASTKKVFKQIVNALEEQIKEEKSPDIFDGRKVVEAETARNLEAMLGGLGPKNEPLKYDHDAYLLEAAMHDLKFLRKQNQHMATRLDMFDKVYTLFSTGNSSGRDSVCQGPIEDSIEKRLYEKRFLATKG